MDLCSPAAQVYDEVRAGLQCLPHTGMDVLPLVLVGLLLLGLGLMLAGWLRIVTARRATEDAYRARHYPYAKRP